MKDGPKSVTIDDLLTVMCGFGFSERRTSDSYYFYHERLVGKKLPRAAIPHGGERKVKKPYIDDCVEAIELLLAQDALEQENLGE